MSEPALDQPAIEQGSSSEPATASKRKKYSGSFLNLARPELANRILRGRPSKCDENTIRDIVEAIEAGSAFAPACVAAGIAPMTASRWIQRGKEHLDQNKASDYATFVEMLVRATAKGQTTHAKFLATSDDWRARGFILERRYPDEWGKKEQSIQGVTLALTNEQLAALGEALLVANLPAVNKRP